MFELMNVRHQGF